MGKDSHNPLKKVERAKRCMSRIKKCGIVWMLSAVLIFIVGIALLAFFAEDISTDKWQKGLGITGIVFILLAIIALALAIFLIWTFCHLIKKQEESMANGGIKNKYHQKPFPADLYPRQPGYGQLQGSPHHGAGGYPGGQPEASVPEKTEALGPDAIVIETDGKY